VAARWPEPNAGVARHVGGSIFGLIFWFFCIKTKEHHVANDANTKKGS